MKNYRDVRFVLVYTMLLNFAVTAVKLAIGFITGSLSLVADGFDSFFDGASNVVGLVGIAIAKRPADPGHPYGHRKFETLSAVSITILLFLTTVQLAQSAFERFRHPAHPEVNVWTAVAILVSVGVHLYVAWYENRRGKELHSEFLVADAKHTQADVLVSIGVGVGMIVVRLGIPIVDPIVALIIAGLIAKIGVDIIRDSSKVLADAAAIDEGEIKKLVGDVPGVLAFHHIRSRGQEDDIHLDLHVRVAPGTPVEQAHFIAHEVEKRLLAGVQGLRDVIVHIEPEDGANNADTDLVQRIRAVARRIPGVAVHAIQVRDLEGKLYATLHLEVEGSRSMDEAHGLANQLEEMLRATLPELADIDSHIEPAERNEEPAVPADEATVSQVRQVLEEATDKIAGLSTLHEMVVSRQGKRLLVGAHWECDGQMSVEEAHTLSRELENRARAKLPAGSQVVVHIEPKGS